MVAVNCSTLWLMLSWRSLLWPAHWQCLLTAGLALLFLTFAYFDWSYWRDHLDCIDIEPIGKPANKYRYCFIIYSSGLDCVRLEEIFCQISSILISRSLRCQVWDVLPRIFAMKLNTSKKTRGIQIFSILDLTPFVWYIFPQSRLY